MAPLAVTMEADMNSGRAIMVSARGAAVLVALLVLWGNASAQDGTWTNTSSGNWSDANNWSGGIVADGSGNTAYFTNDITADLTVHLDSARTNGSLVFGDANTNTAANWTLDDTNTLTLAGSSTGIAVNALGPGMGATISANVALPSGNDTINVATGGLLTLAGSIDATGGNTTLQKIGAGVLKMTGPYTGGGNGSPINVNGGTLKLADNIVYTTGIYASWNAINNVSIVANNSTIDCRGGAFGMGTVLSTTAAFDMHGGSLAIGWLGMGTGNFGGNQSITTIDSNAVISLSAIEMGDNQTQSGGATCFTLKGGTIVGDNNSSIRIGIHSGENVVNQLGGTFKISQINLQYRMGVADNYACLYNLDGGTLTTDAIETGDGALVTGGFQNKAYVNCHGGTLKPAADEMNFIRTTITGPNAGIAAPHVVVWSEGAVIDTDGHAVTIQQPLVAPVGSGVYVNVSGDVNVSLVGTNGGSGYHATPLIRIGRLIAGNTATAVANMADDGTGRGTYKVDSITITNPGFNFTNVPAISVSGGDPAIPVAFPALSVATNVSGGLTKKGAGRLALTGFNTYTGETAVVEGSLELAQACLADESSVRLAGGVGLVLSFQGIDRIGALYYRGAAQPQGLYGAGALDGAISGTGLLKVTKGPMPKGFYLTVK